MERITEMPSHYDHLEELSTEELLTDINREDCRVAEAVGKVLPSIAALVDAVTERLKQGGRVFYVGAGTSGRLGILDASELPPTYGVSEDLFIGLIAGGEEAIRRAVEGAEDDELQGWLDVEKHCPRTVDTVIGIAASGTTPYVLGAVRRARERGLLTGCITSNPGAPLTQMAEHAIVAKVGPEFVTGSSRMKSGSAQKMILNMISTSCMIKLGRVKGNRMVDMKPSNEKLVARGVRMIVETLGLTEEEAESRLLHLGSVRQVIDSETNSHNHL